MATTRMAVAPMKAARIPEVPIQQANGSDKDKFKRRVRQLDSRVYLIILLIFAALQCHVPPLFTEPGWNAHKPSDIGVDDFQANRAPDKTYRTAPLRGLFSHMKGGFYHDGRVATLVDVVNHYNQFKRLNLSDQEKNDLVEYLKSL